MKLAVSLLLIGIAFINDARAQKTGVLSKICETLKNKIVQSGSKPALQFREVQDIFQRKDLYGGETCLTAVIKNVEFGNKGKPLNQQTKMLQMDVSQCTSDNMAKIFCLAKTNGGAKFVKVFCGPKTDICPVIKSNLFGDMPVCEGGEDQQRMWAFTFSDQCSTAPSWKILAFLSSKAKSEIENYLDKFDKAAIKTLITELVKNPKAFAAFKNSVKHGILYIAKKKGAVADIISNFKQNVNAIKSAGAKGATDQQKDILDIAMGILLYQTETECNGLEQNDQLLTKVAELYNDAKWQSHLAGKALYYQCDCSNSVKRKPTAVNESKAFSYMKAQKLDINDDDCNNKCGEKLFSKITAGSNDDLVDIARKYGSVATCASYDFLKGKLQTITQNSCQNIPDKIKEVIKSKTLDQERVAKCKPQNKSPDQYSQQEQEDMGCDLVCGSDGVNIISKLKDNAKFCTVWKIMRNNCTDESCKKKMDQADGNCRNDVDPKSRPASLSGKELQNLPVSDKKEVRKSINVGTKKGRAQHAILDTDMTDAEKRIETNTLDKLKSDEGKRIVSSMPPTLQIDVVKGVITTDNIIDLAGVLKGPAEKTYKQKLKEFLQNGDIEITALIDMHLDMKEDIECIDLICYKVKLSSPSASFSDATPASMNKMRNTTRIMVESLAQSSQSGEVNITEEVQEITQNSPKESLHYLATNESVLKNVTEETKNSLKIKAASDPKRSCSLNAKRKKEDSDTLLKEKNLSKQTSVGDEFTDFCRILLTAIEEGNLISGQLGNGFFESEGLAKCTQGPKAMNKTLKDLFVKEIIQQQNFDNLPDLPAQWLAVVCDQTTLTSAQKSKCSSLPDSVKTQLKEEMENNNKELTCKKIGLTKEQKAEMETNENEVNEAVKKMALGTEGQNSGRKRRAAIAYACSTIQLLETSEVVSVMTVENIGAMTTSEFSSCVDYFGQITGWSATQYTALFEKAMNVLGIASPYSSISSSHSSVIGTLAHGLTVSQINGLSDMASLMLDFGVLSEWTTSQLSALVTKYMSASSISQASALTAANLIEVGHAVCGLSSAQISTIPAAVYLNAAATVNNMTTGDSSCLSALATLAQDSAAYGPASAWDIYTYSAAGIIIAGLSASDLNQADAESVAELEQHLSLIPTSVFQQLSTTFLENITREATRFVTQAQRDTLNAEQLNALARAEAGFDGYGATVQSTTGGSDFVAASIVTTVLSLVILHAM